MYACRCIINLDLGPNFYLEQNIKCEKSLLKVITDGVVIKRSTIKILPAKFLGINLLIAILPPDHDGIFLKQTHCRHNADLFMALTHWNAM